MGGPTITESTTVSSNIPKELQPYSTRVLGNAEALTNIGYERYPGQQLAEFNPLQNQAFGDISRMRVSPETNQAAGMAGLAGLRAEQMGRYNPTQERNFYNSPQYQGMGIGYNQLYNEQFSPQAAQQYMSPYMQSVVDQQKQSAIQDYARQLPGAQSNAFRSGAGRGTRSALLQAEGNRNLQNQLGTIQTQGLQQAYQQGMGQFNTDQAQRMQAAQANQNAQLQAQQQGLGQNQFMNQFGQQNAATAAQYGLQGQQQAEQSRQFGANLGMQGLQQQLSAAGVLGGLGQQRYQQGLGINQAQQQAGTLIEAKQQQGLTNAYQDFINQQELPYKQLGFMSDLIRGTPMGNTNYSFYKQPGSVLSQIGGLGLQAAGLSGLTFGGGK